MTNSPKSEKNVVHLNLITVKIKKEPAGDKVGCPYSPKLHKMHQLGKTFKSTFYGAVSVQKNCRLY